VSGTEVEYSNYISYHIMAANTYSLFMGFTFTATVVLLTLLPNPSLIMLQIILLVLTLTFNILGFLLFHIEAVLAYCVTIAPQLPRKYNGSILIQLSNLTWYMLTRITVLMFFVWNLTYLAVATAIIGASFIIWARATTKPLYEAVGKKWTRK
jgi:hypothetical protein